MKRTILFAIPLSLLIACGGNTDDNKATTTVAETPTNTYLDEYPEVPEGAAIYANANDSSFNELKEKYVRDLVALKNAIEANHSKMLLLLITPEVGVSATASTKKGAPLIASIAQEQGIELIDISALVANRTVEELTQMPKDGHWSANGAQLIADAIAPHIEKYNAHRSDISFDKRPDLFGDQDPNVDRIEDGGKDLPYHVVTNAQGLRMSNALSFPKAKQRILFLGDSQMFSPFLDNDKTTIGVLQQRFPDKEMINAARIGYTVEDMLSLYNERAKYTEADVVIVATNPNDIPDYFFAQRNRMARMKKPYAPSEKEKNLYDQLFKK